MLVIFEFNGASELSSEKKRLFGKEFIECRKTEKQMKEAGETINSDLQRMHEGQSAMRHH